MTTKEMTTTRMPVLALMGALMLCAGTAHASPEGGDVVEGEADIDYGDWTRVVTGEITIIEWLSFNIAAGETVEFIMPSEASRVLNLINSGVPTEIMGNLIGNGQIFLVNPSGVIFGQGAVVNVGALYAAAGNISNSDFMNGVYRFTDARGVVENRGLLEGDMVALIGGRVANHGTISAPGGTVVMAAGEQVLIGEHLGHVFVRLEKPTDLDNTDLLSDLDGVDLAAGDVFSLAAWNTGEIDASSTTVAVSAGHMAIDSDMHASELTLVADGGSHIELGADLSSDGEGVFLEGDTVLTGDVSVDLTGGDGVIAFKGRVDSRAGEEHDLLVHAGEGTVRFSGSVGTGYDGARLGTLDVSAADVRLYGDVAVNDQMNFYAPVQVSGSSTTFDVGFGTALFAGPLYSSITGGSDVEFLYSGSAWVGTGEARTPYRFRDSIGARPGDAGRGMFRNIVFGGDLSDPSRVSAFLFGTGAVAGLDLMSMNDVDLSHRFSINATRSIRMGRGQKMVSFGSLSMNAIGGGALIEVGDLNVLGDLRLTAVGDEGEGGGGSIRFLGHAPGEIDWTGNEADRDLAGLIDTGTELIASGDITLNGELLFDGPVLLGGSSVSIYNNSGMGDAGPLDIGVFPGGVSLELFRGMLAGTGDLLYPYDLTVGTLAAPRAELATVFSDEGPVNLRTDDPRLAQTQVLRELALNPRPPRAEAVRRSLDNGVLHYDENGAAEFGVTLERLSYRSVERLTGAYVALFGDRMLPEGALRERDGDIRNALAGKTGERERGAVVERVRAVLRSIELLELTPPEIARAQRALLERIKPDSMGMEPLIEMIRGAATAVAAG